MAFVPASGVHYVQRPRETLGSTVHSQFADLVEWAGCELLDLLTAWGVGPKQRDRIVARAKWSESMGAARTRYGVRLSAATDERGPPASARPGCQTNPSRGSCLWTRPWSPRDAASHSAIRVGLAHSGGLSSRCAEAHMRSWTKALLRARLNFESSVPRARTVSGRATLNDGMYFSLWLPTTGIWATLPLPWRRRECSSRSTPMQSSSPYPSAAQWSRSGTCAVP